MKIKALSDFHKYRFIVLVGNYGPLEVKDFEQLRRGNIADVKIDIAQKLIDAGICSLVENKGENPKKGGDK